MSDDGLRPCAIRDEWAKFPHPKQRPRNRADGRTHFQRDGDRILYCDAFRKLAGKTQVFLAGAHDLMRTRLTHTMEVVQISKRLAQYLDLNVDLVEAIALGHDVGHTPFGHAGEDVLKHVTSGCDGLSGTLPENSFVEAGRGFRHNLQSARVLHELEAPYSEHPGLNLSGFVLWGVAHHSRLWWSARCRAPMGCPLNEWGTCPKGAVAPFPLAVYRATLRSIPMPCCSVEAFVVAQADEIAQRHHDLEDAYLTGLVTLPDLKRLAAKLQLPPDAGAHLLGLRPTDAATTPEVVRGALSRAFVHGLSIRLVEETRRRLKRFERAHGISSANDMQGWLLKHGLWAHVALGHLVAYPSDFAAKEKALHKALETIILNSGPVQRMDGKARFLLRQLWKAYLSNPQQLPDRVVLRLVRAEGFDWQWRPGRGRPPLSNVFSTARRRLGSGVSTKPQRARLRQLLARAICDHLASMTDQEAVEEHQRLYSSHAESVHIST